MSVAEQRAALAAAVYRCRDCGRSADYACDDGKVNPPRRERRGSVEIDVQDFATFHLCQECCHVAVRSDTPPRTVTALPHMADTVRAAASAKRKKQREDFKAAHDRLGDDWGIPT